MRMAALGPLGLVIDSTRIVGASGSVAMLERMVFQRSSEGSQLLVWRSEAIQISEGPVTSERNAMARLRRAGMSAAVSVAAVDERVGRSSGEEISCSSPLALSTSINRGLPRFLMEVEIFSNALSRRDWLDAVLISIDAERSRMRTTVLIDPLPQPVISEITGRAAAMARAVMPNARQVRIAMWRSFFSPRYWRVALSRKRIAAHSMVLWRRRLTRWITTGTAAASRNQRRDGERKCMV